ncbi:MAG: hypothetical protein AUH30_10990 [Candidatus Rokubacteria bacterium 13_1_40CM_68_15]|nr:MAG: hypothetical protein AUH30_10990 [Candidatus Rokubacteria bacterium 13_1_40CM_68_15]
MRWTRAIVAVTLALAAGVTTVASAAQSPQAQTEQQPRWDNRLQQQLGLSDQQVQAIREIYQRDADTKRQHWQQLRQAQAELRHLALTSSDNQTIQAKQDEVQRLMAQSVQMRTSTLRQVAPILTPDQREKLAQLMERGGHGRHRRQAS